MKPLRFDQDTHLVTEIEKTFREASALLASGEADEAWETGLAAFSLLGDRHSVHTASQLFGDIVSHAFLHPRSEKTGNTPLLNLLTMQAHSLATKPQTMPLSRETGAQAYALYGMMKACRPNDVGAINSIIFDCKQRGLSLNWLLDLALGALLEYDRSLAVNAVNFAYEEIPGLFNAFAQIVHETDRPNALFADALTLLKLDKEKNRLSFNQLLVYVHCMAGSGYGMEVDEFVAGIYSDHPEVKNLRSFVGWLRFMRGHEANEALCAFQQDEKEGRSNDSTAGLYITTLSLNGLVEEAESKLTTLHSEGKSITDGYALIGWHHDVVVAHDTQQAKKRFDIARESCSLSPLFQCLNEALSTTSDRCSIFLQHIEETYNRNSYLRDIASICGGYFMGAHGDIERMKDLYLYDFQRKRQNAWAQLVLRALIRTPASLEEHQVIAPLNIFLSQAYSTTLCLIAKRWLYLSGIDEQTVETLLSKTVLSEIESNIKRNTFAENK